MIYRAGQLDARNIGSTITIEEDDKITHGSIALIEQHATTTEILLMNDDTPFSLPRAKQVEVALSQDANYGFYSSRSAERIEALLRELTTPAAATLKAV